MKEARSWATTFTSDSGANKAKRQLDSRKEGMAAAVTKTYLESSWQWLP